jgi:predicted outer membrane protein
VHLTPAHQRIVERLTTLSGEAFDRDFVDVMVQEHRQAIRDFEAHSRAHGNAITGGKKQGTVSDQQAACQKPTAPDQRTYSREEVRLDVDTAEFAATTLPTLRRHLEQAEEILKNLPAK